MEAMKLAAQALEPVLAVLEAPECLETAWFR
jgi:hypothetical protein